MNAAIESKPAAIGSTLRSSANAIPIKNGVNRDIMPSVPLYTLLPVVFKPSRVAMVPASRRTPSDQKKNFTKI